MNWKVRIRNKNFWVAIIPMAFLFVQQLCAVFGVSIDLTETQGRIMELVNTIFMILGIIGIVNDPTTAGLHDSNLAMTYERPKDDFEGVM